MKCLHVELYSQSTKQFVNNNTQIVYKIILYLSYLQDTHRATIRGAVTFVSKVFKYMIRHITPNFGPKFPSFQFRRLPDSFVEQLALLLSWNIILVQRFFFRKLGFKLFRVLQILMQSLFSFNLHEIFARFFQKFFIAAQVIIKQKFQLFSL